MSRRVQLSPTNRRAEGSANVSDLRAVSQAHESIFDVKEMVSIMGEVFAHQYTYPVSFRIDPGDCTFEGRLEEQSTLEVWTCVDDGFPATTDSLSEQEISGRQLDEDHLKEFW